VMELIGGIAGEDRRCVIIVTHDMRILGFADRVAHMDDGRIVQAGVPAEGEHL